MSATLVQNAASGEDLIGIDPQLLEQVAPGWLHRLALFNGRTLTADALQHEQAYRAGRLAILGQCVTQGIVKGLELSADLTTADPVLQVMPGYGISASGEDVALQRTLQSKLSALLVIDPQTGNAIDTFANYSKNASNTTFAGVLLLQPITAAVTGASLDTGAQPLIVSGNLNASCDQDPDEYAFEDSQIADGVRLVMVAWPADAALSLPPVSPAATWRNRLVYTVFDAELALAADDRLAWDMLGVPVALVGFDNTWKVQFVDRSAVVRSGGLPRSRYLSVPQAKDASMLLAVQPAIAQARVLQLSEQLGASPALTNVLQSFAFLPPCGVLPAAAIDFINQVAPWLPPTWSPTLRPVYQEELESALLAGMTAQPLDVTQNETIDILVPLPDSVYDPNVLIQDTVAPAFQEAVNSATQELAVDLQHRYVIQQEANALSQALNGTQAGPLYDVNAGLTSNEIGLRNPVFAVGNHSITAVYSGDAANPKSTSVVLVQTVLATVGPVALSSSLYPSITGQSVTFTATVAPGTQGPATGNVQFIDGSTNLGSPVTLVNGVASISVSNLTVGTHSVTAAYSGDASNPKGTSAALAQIVTAPSAAAAVALSSSLFPSVSGQNVTLTATVTPSSATGTVQFMDGANPLGPPVPLSAGVARLPYAPASNESFGTTVSNGAYVSKDYQKLITDAATTYTVTLPNGTKLGLFSNDDMNDMAEDGIQHFVDRINAKLARANDLLDLAFLTTQSDIYRLRNYVLGASGATALAVSPIVAQIATGESAAVTANNLQSYLSTILPAKTAAGAATSSGTSGGSSTGTVTNALLFKSTSFRSALLSPTRIANPTLSRTIVAAKPITQNGTTGTTATTIKGSLAAGRAFTQVQPGTVSQPASPGDITGQSPLVGAELNLRTLTIADRLQNPPSQDALFYATGNRMALLQLLADLEITIDDIPILVDVPVPSTTPPPTTTPAPAPFRIADIRLNADATKRTAVYNAVLNPVLTENADESSLFSTSISVLELHSQLLRAVEARIAEYNDFLTECSTAIANIQTDLPQAQTLVTQLSNDLAQARQDLAFTTALLNDETARVKAVNAQRATILQNVPAVVYTRPRTLQPDASVPSRQLVPGNIASPVPSCLKQGGAVPPELTEIVGLLREAPANWLPSIEALLNRLTHRTLLQELAADMQARATMLLALPALASSASTEAGVYAPVISSLFSYNQQAFRTFQSQRAVFQPAQLAGLSWTAQVQSLQTVAAAGDLISSRIVQAEVANATSRLLQQISSVATCVYTRACQALPIDRLAWAEFLRGVGLSIQMQSLAVLPNWNTLDYVSRQQMQMLVDWLFRQIDTTIPNAVAFMSDVVRVAILLASDAPLNQVIGGAVSLATTPVVGGVVSLTLPSQRIANGMYVQLYSSGTLAARAVVTDLDTASVRATVTEVYQPGATLQLNDVAHFTVQPPESVAIRAFDM